MTACLPAYLQSCLPAFLTACLPTASAALLVPLLRLFVEHGGEE